MKRFVFFLFTGALLTGMKQAPAAEPAQDVIHTKSGLEIAGSISRAGKDSLQVRSKSATGTLVTQQVPVANVDHVDFAGFEKIDTELPAYNNASVAQLLQKWRSLQPLVDIPDSPAGLYGIRAAEILLDSSSPQAAVIAGEILDQILKSDWDATNRDRARTLVIESMRRTGKHDEAIKAAREFLATNASPESEAEVSYYLGLALMDDYDAFVVENPRWENDPYMRPKRDRLYNEVLDCLLAPYLRYGAPPDATTKSLLAAAKFLAAAGEQAEGRALAEDIVKMLPAQSEAAQAKKFLEEN